MKARFLGVLFILVVSVLLNVPMAQACADVPAVDAFFTALNTGDIDTALATLTEDATIDVLARQETYLGAAEIGPMLQAMQRQGRQFEVVGSQMSGDTVMLTVEISDHGQVWGTETITAQVNSGRLHSLQVTAFQLKL